MMAVISISLALPWGLVFDAIPGKMRSLFMKRGFICYIVGLVVVYCCILLNWEKADNTTFTVGDIEISVYNIVLSSIMNLFIFAMKNLVCGHYYPEDYVVLSSSLRYIDVDEVTAKLFELAEKMRRLHM